MRGITFIIKPVGDVCNLACDYCYFRAQCGNRISTKISCVVLEKFISEYLTLPQDRYNFVWHGGEPLLAGIDFFEEAIRLQNAHRREGQRIYNSIQTNATLIDEEWLSFLRENHFQIGVSLDGPAKIHNAQRCYSSGEGSFADVMKGIALLQKEKIAFALLTVLTKKSHGHEEEIFDFFVRSNLCDFDLLPCIANVGAELECAVTPQEFARSAMRFFDLWWQLDRPEVRIRLFESTVRGILGAEQNVCKFAGACASYCTLNYDGDIYPCDSFVGIDEFVFGNINESGLAGILNSPARRRFITEVQTLPNDCSGCQWRAICNGGCTYHRYMQRGILSDKSYFCSSRKILFQRVQKRVEEAQ